MQKVERHLADAVAKGARVVVGGSQAQTGQSGQFMAPTVLGSWGVHRTNDFGEIVFSMIEIGQMRKTRRDKLEDFHDVYDFNDAFSRDLAFVVPDAV